MTTTLTSGMLNPANPMLRRKGTGMTTIDTSPMATVRPLNATERPAVAMASETACSPATPWESCSRHRVTSKSE